MGFEPMTSSLPRKCSTPELGQRLLRFPRRQRGKPYVNFRRGVKDGNENCFLAPTFALVFNPFATTILANRVSGAGDGARTHDRQFGKLMLYH